MEFTSVIERFNSELWYFHIMVPGDIAEEMLEIATDKRVVCTINGELSFQCALMPDGNGQYFINLNNDRRKKLGLDQGIEVTVQLAPDKSEYGLPVPEEFAELISQDEEGNVLFHKLTKGRQRSLLHMIGSPKRTETRLKKALIILDYLKEVNGKLDFKELNEYFKANNRYS